MCDINKNKMLMGVSDFSVDEYLEKLLVDKTTGKNIIFATDDYSNYGYDKYAEMTEIAIRGMDADAIQPRIKKSLEEQARRTKVKAEVFTPAWICNRMNNHCDEEWFGRRDVFNKEVDTDEKHIWVVTEGKIIFPDGKRWQRYVDSKRLEITCGEAPYIVSRYDAATGVEIPVRERIGILDRKLRVVDENTEDYADWIKWVYRAFQSVYGYEFQGDNLLIARINLLVSFAEHMQERWGCFPKKNELKKVVNIIAWNIWQMDGLTGQIPFSKPIPVQGAIPGLEKDSESQNKNVECKIQDWRAKESIMFNNIKLKK